MLGYLRIENGSLKDRELPPDQKIYISDNTSRTINDD